MASGETVGKGSEDNINVKPEDDSRAETDSDERQKQPNGQSTEFNGDDKSDQEEDLLNQLEGIDLTEDDTEILLEEAYAMNRKLKEILKQQESEGRKSTQRQVNGSRSAGPRHRVLPPIKNAQNSKQSNLYSARMSRPAQSGSPVKRTSPQNRQYTSSSQFSKETSANGRRAKPQQSARSSSDRPQWNERFSFS